MNNWLNLSEVDISFKEVRPFQYRERNTSFCFKEKSKEKHAIVFMKFGSISYNVDDRIIRLEKGDILLLKKGEAYNAYNSDGPEIPYAFYVVYFDIFEDEIPYFKRLTKVSHYEKFLDLFTKGYDIGKKRGTAYKFILKSVLSEILYNLYKEYYSSKITEPSFLHMEKAKKHIDVHYNDKINIAELADLSGFSRAHFKRLFSKYYNTTPSEYITTVRIEHAKIMLESNIFSLKEIADQCGFYDEYYFSKVFQKKVGCPPKKYWLIFYLDI